MKNIKTLNWGIGVAGVWTMSTPFVLGYTDTATALWNDLIVGVVIVILAAVAASSQHENNVKTMDWITAGLGLWLVLAPFIFGYSVIAAALWSDLLGGVVILVLAVWAERVLAKALGPAS
jgi:SPW repeat-containing protein